MQSDRMWAPEDDPPRSLPARASSLTAIHLPTILPIIIIIIIIIVIIIITITIIIIIIVMINSTIIVIIILVIIIIIIIVVFFFLLVLIFPMLEAGEVIPVRKLMQLLGGWISKFLVHREMLEKGFLEDAEDD
ncbi:hypothetical protein AK812_SmicGene30500 [Symbiodinium microadriaticum]|uniref:ABC transmembrane type-1 domain-containing protein n=1 Tax=Symbiodinium microadriaticum TaxID=2951 RepID=A0A1Q9CZ52_SYMMI|nr:hypothetical protein AK812_SmicGene30500 [Symbiodinium microadriaticum]